MRFPGAARTQTSQTGAGPPDRAAGPAPIHFPSDHVASRFDSMVYNKELEL